MTREPTFQFPHIYIYMLIRVLLIYSICFFSNLLFFKEEKDLPFSNMCRPSSFAEMNLISGNLINLII